MTIELIAPELMPRAVKPVVDDVVLSVRVSVSVVEGAGRVRRTKAGMVKLWPLALAVQTNSAPEEVPVIWTVLLGSPPVQVTLRGCDRSIELMPA